jgi:hypothetical protein
MSTANVRYLQHTRRPLFEEGHYRPCVTLIDLTPNVRMHSTPSMAGSRIRGRGKEKTPDPPLGFRLFQNSRPFWSTVICVLLSKMFILNLVDCVPILLSHAEQGVRMPRRRQGGPYSARLTGDASRIRKSSRKPCITMSSLVLGVPAPRVRKQRPRVRNRTTRLLNE